MGKGERGQRSALFRSSAQHNDTRFPAARSHDVAVKQLDSLEAWKCSKELARSAYRLTLQAPLSHHFRLSDQIRRAAISIPANIAEGYALGSTAQFLRCLKISLGSATELFTHLSLLHALSILPDPEVAQCLELCDRVVSMIIGLIRKLMGRGALTHPASRLPHPASERIQKSLG